MWRLALGRLSSRAVCASRRSPVTEKSRAVGSLAGVGFGSPSRVLRAADDKDIDDFGIATGLEREELEFARAGLKRWEDPPVGPFGTAENPAIIQSYYNERIVGCPGGPGDDEHDVIWFRLRKGERHECSICGQIFELKCIGDGKSSHH